MVIKIDYAELIRLDVNLDFKSLISSLKSNICILFLGQDFALKNRLHLKLFIENF
jgi:hypothetical protein